MFNPKIPIPNLRKKPVNMPSFIGCPHCGKTFPIKLKLRNMSIDIYTTAPGQDVEKKTIKTPSTFKGRTVV